MSSSAGCLISCVVVFWLGYCVFLAFAQAFGGSVDSYSWQPCLVTIACIMAIIGIILLSNAEKRQQQEQRIRAYEAQLQHQRTLDVFLLLSPSDFERVCADLLARLGFTNIHRTGKSGDRAITCITPYGVSAIVRCKRYDTDKPVDFPSIQHLMRMVYIDHQAQK